MRIAPVAILDKLTAYATIVKLLTISPKQCGNVTIDAEGIPIGQGTRGQEATCPS